MPLVAAPAVVLKLVPYSDTSRIVRLLTRDHGVVSALARGVRRARSRSAVGMDLFALGIVGVRLKSQTDLHTLTSFDLTRAHHGLAADVGRFSAASALAELALKCVPAAAHAEAFDAVETGLEALDRAAPAEAEAAALAACWRLVTALGFEPVLDRCAVCGAAVGDTLAFSALHGGGLCATHRGEAGRTNRLAPEDRDALRALLDGRWPEPPLDARHAAAHRRLLAAFIRHHLAEDRPLPALDFWDKAAWTVTSS